MPRYYLRKIRVSSRVIKYGYDPNTLDDFGQNPFFKIVYNSRGTQIDFLRLFISYGANINFQNSGDLSSPVFHATGNALKVLIENGAKLKIKNKHGSTPLHSVTNVENAELLIKLGLNINEKDNLFSTLLHESVFETNELVKFLLTMVQRLMRKT